MNCKQVIDIIPQIIKREIQSDKRVLSLEHLKTCASCRLEYHKFLNMFYNIDFKIVQPEPELEDYLINIADLNIKRPKSMAFIWAAAAVFLIIFFSTFVLMDDFYSPHTELPRKHTVSEIINSEDWIELSDMLSDKTALDKIATEKIPVKLLLSKLDVLQQRGIERFQMVSLSEKNMVQEIRVNLLRKKLNEFKKYKSDITITELSGYISWI